MTIVRLLIFYFLVIPTLMFAQGGVQFGVDWEVPGSINEQKQQLDTFASLGIRIIQIEGIVDSETLGLINDTGFELWVSSGVKFYRPSDFPEQNQLTDKLTDPLFYYRNNEIAISRYTLFEHPLASSTFIEMLDEVIPIVRQLFAGPTDVLIAPGIRQEISPLINIGLTKDNFVQYHIGEVPDDRIAYIHILDNAFNVNAARQFRDILLDKNTSRHVWIFDSHTLINLEPTSDFVRILKAFSTNSTAVVALGPELAEEDTMVIITIVILILVTLFAAIFTTNAGYQRSFTRYFLTHNFYVNDVMLKRTRFTGAVPLSWALSVFFGMLLTWITFDTVFNDNTTEMIMFHYPAFGNILNNGVLSVLLFSALSLIAVQFITFAWVATSTIGKSTFSQIAQIILIPQQLIVPLSIIASLVYLNTYSPIFMLVSYASFVVIVLISVPLTSVDILRHSQGKNRLNWLFGPVLFTTLLVILITYVVEYTAIPDTIRLLLSLV